MSEPGRALSIETDTEEGVAVVALVGELDAATSAELQAELARFAEGQATTVLVDLSELGFIDSSGLNALAASARSIEASGGSLTLAGASAHIQQVFDIVHLATQVRIEPSVEDAVRALRSPPSDTTRQ